MKKEISERVLKETEEILRTKKTIREIAKEFNVSKSTVHKDLHERLYQIDEKKYQEVKELMEFHIDIRHIRGGESTRKRYSKTRKS